MRSRVRRSARQPWVQRRLLRLLAGAGALAIVGLLLSRGANSPEAEVCFVTGGCLGLTVRVGAGLLLYAVGFFGTIVSGVLLTTRLFRGGKRTADRGPIYSADVPL